MEINTPASYYRAHVYTAQNGPRTTATVYFDRSFRALQSTETVPADIIASYSTKTGTLLDVSLLCHCNLVATSKPVPSDPSGRPMFKMKWFAVPAQQRPVSCRPARFQRIYTYIMRYVATSAESLGMHYIFFELT